MKIDALSNDELQKLERRLLERYEAHRREELALDLTRGKPSKEQLDLSAGLDTALAGAYTLADGTDARNYGGLRGIAEARAFGAQMLGLVPDEVIVGGNSSLLLMYQYMGFAHLHGVAGPGSGWREEAASQQGRVKFLCPVPGYDRHFTLCEHYDIEMINVAIGAEGPDMDQIETLVSNDPLIKGIWCVPKYSNPTGVTYSDAVVRRMAGLSKSAGPNFRIFWDDAYAVHHLSDEPQALLDIMGVCRELGTAESVVVLGSTSKITYAGAGISFLGSSPNNIAAFEKHLSVAMIGPDKINQLRHVRFLKDAAHLRDHMARHRAIIAPKFERVLAILEESLADRGVANWTRPDGGYFISFDTLPGLASKVVELAGDVGVKLTPAGATFPYGRDPEDRNIRLAPTFPSLDELEKAMRVFVTCVEMATVQQRLEVSV